MKRSLTCGVLLFATACGGSSGVDGVAAQPSPSPAVSPSASPPPVASPSPSAEPEATDPRLVANATRCKAPDEGAMDALRASAPGLRLDNPAMLVTSAVGTAANGVASRYTYLAGELADGPAVWAAVNVYQHGGWLAVNGLAKAHSSAPSADSTDAAVSRNIDDYSQVVGCTAEGGFPGGAPFSAPPDGEG